MPSFSGAGPSRTSAHQNPRLLHQFTPQQPQTPKLDVFGLQIDSELAPTGNLAQETLQEDEDEAGMQAFLPGTFVEIRRNDKSVNGIALAETIEKQRYVMWSLTSSGNILSHQRSDVHFAIPNLISVSLAERCGYGEPTPENRMARVEALKRLQTMVSKVDRQTAGMQQRPLNTYIEVMDPDPTRWTTTTVAHVTNLMYDRPAFMDYYMVHRYLMEQPLYYIANPGYLKTQEFSVRPRRDIEEIEEVTKHIQTARDDGDSPFSSFVAKARTVVQRYKERRESGPIIQEMIPVDWNRQDRIFINFLLRSLQPHRSNQLDPYTTGRTELVRAILEPKSPVNDHLTHELVVKLGVVAPWQDIHELIPTLNPWGDFSSKKTVEIEAHRIFKSSLASAVKAGSVLGPMDLIPSDPLESVRHDFGDSRVFVIDDPTAQELDDGISLERIPNEPENHWVHVHIANPTSVIHPNHALAKMARQQGTTCYLSQKTIPLFPTSLVHSPKFSLSLGQTVKKAINSNRVMTFSIKLDGNGNILDYKVRAGIIRNVKKASYDQVDVALGLPPPNIWYPLGGTQKAGPNLKLDKLDIDDLRILRKLAQDQETRNFEQGRWQFLRSHAQIKWNNKIPVGVRSPSLDSNLYHGFPDLAYQVEEGVDTSGSRSLVAEMMKLANRVASRFLNDHNVPCIRYGMDQPIAKTPEDLEELLNKRSPTGHVPMQEVVKHLALNSSAVYCLEPKQHFGLGTPEGEGYTRATSPLRRFSDLVCHWQLQHILLGSKSPRPPFSTDDLEKMIVELEPVNKVRTNIMKQNSLFYSLMCLKRYMDETGKGAERPFGDPLASMVAWSKRTSHINHHTGNIDLNVHIPLLGIAATVDGAPKSVIDIPAGTDFRVKIKSVELGIKRTRLFVSIIG